MTTTAQETYKAQQALSFAKSQLSYLKWEERGPSKEALAEAETAVAEARAIVEPLQAALGGTPYRVPNQNITALQARIEKLNKRATKIGTEPVALTITSETEETTYKTIQGKKMLIEWTYLILTGKAPVIEGFQFMASLDHTVAQGLENALVTINRVPFQGAELEAIDLSAYRTAENRCDHCGFQRQRNQTYVLYEIATAKTIQVGSTCLRDFTGANNPERIARYAEFLAALTGDLEIGGYEEFGSSDGGREAVSLLGYMTHVATMTREHGYEPRSRSDFPTADQAWSNMDNLRYKPKLASEPTEEDRELATAALTWVRDELAEQDEVNEFEHNLIAVTQSDYMPAKGDGYVAYIIQAYNRAMGKAIERKVEAEVAATSEYIAEQYDRIELTFTPTFVREIASNYGATYLTKGITPEGNRILWFASTELEKGTTYTGRATVKELAEDDYSAGAKTTQITRGSFRELEEGEIPPGTTVVTSGAKKREKANA